MPFAKKIAPDCPLNYFSLSIFTSLDGSISGEEIEEVFTGAVPPKGAVRDARFWLIIVSLLVTTFLAALDLTAIPTALPTITDQLSATDAASFVWIGAAYTMSSTASTTILGGLSYVFGRRSVLVSSPPQ